MTKREIKSCLYSMTGCNEHLQRAVTALNLEDYIRRIQELLWQLQLNDKGKAVL